MEKIENKIITVTVKLKKIAVERNFNVTIILSRIWSHKTGTKHGKYRDPQGVISKIKKTFIFKLKIWSHRAID